MAIELHADRSRPARVDAQSLPWIASPQRGVDRRMLERSGDEVAVATSIVRYAAGSHFPEHVHELGEEFVVLRGTFCDEAGEYPAGSYVRNPPGSRHAPSSPAGCVIFVKLRQMGADESEFVRIFPAQRRWQATRAAGIERAPLYANARLSVALLRLAAGAVLLPRRIRGGEEVFVLEGAVETLEPAPRTLGAWSWQRTATQRQPAVGSAAGALLWIKRGHL